MSRGFSRMPLFDVTIAGEINLDLILQLVHRVQTVDRPQKVLFELLHVFLLNCNELAGTILVRSNNLREAPGVLEIAANCSLNLLAGSWFGPCHGFLRGWFGRGFFGRCFLV